MPLIYFLPPLATVLIWSGNMTINQLSVDAIAPSSIAFLRWLLALVVMTPFVLPAVLRHKDEIVRNWPKLALLGLLGMGLWQGLAYIAAETTTATNMGILAAMVWAMNLPPWVMLYAQVCFAVLFLLPPYLMGPMTPVDGKNVWLILYAGIPASVITTFLWMRAVRQIGANQASIFINLMPLFSALIAMA